MSRSLTYILTLSIPILLVLTNIYFFMTPSYLDYEYGKSDFHQRARLPRAPWCAARV
ncbi:MAG: hypothetical protein HY070_09290 [Chloroflexi bacterium]|nr:hypothetical protein [Chloroflexota bacterium]